VLTIGQLSSVCGVPTSTIRFWERRELLAPQARQGGQRRYDEDTLYQVGILRLCQDAGFTLAEIKQVIDRRLSGGLEWRQFVAAKMADIENSLNRLNKAHDMLSHALECEHDDITQCPKFQAAVVHRSGVPTGSALPELAG
jgi:MerR family redox-sensitive transcriptional activator SoxR